ncbi:hypothetical protein NQ317_015353 [Molorchus minor]|uniref:NR LBD domain-containing protein n=1 Tax=Molorchus minor TaxID=1323400 RepID=A0ABQ9IVQ7_9CUCU|nr:hypothetical protein NQ317_015353 [Molorchus minor]
MTAIIHEGDVCDTSRSRPTRARPPQAETSADLHPHVHHSQTLGHGLRHMTTGDNKLPTSSGSFHFGSGLFGPPHHPLKALSLPPPPPVSSPVSHIDALPISMFHPPSMPPPPGLLHILMSAEKCQGLYVEEKVELVWGTKLSQIESAPSETSSGLLSSHSGLPLTSSPPLTTLPLTPTWEMLQETTARLLFMAVRWVRCLAPFQTLSKHDQLLLLQESWKELFLLHLAQWSVPWDLSTLLGCPQARERLPADIHTATEIKTIQEIMCRFRQISPDGSECGCMKAILLFTPETAGLCDVQPVEMLQDQAQCILGDYVRTRYPRQPTRFGRLLLLVPSLRAIRPLTVELLFFKETIGEIPITQLLGDMYYMEKCVTQS